METDPADRSDNTGRSLSRTILFWTGLLLLLVIDQASKVWARNTLQDGPAISWLGDLFRWTYAENPGAFLSLGANFSDATRFWMMTVLNGVVLCLLLAWLTFSRNASRWQQWAIGFLLVGGAGNLIDRIAYDGVVIDFMNIGLGSLRSGIFNVADMLISAGVLMLLCESFWKTESHKPQSTTVEQKSSSTTSLLIFLAVTLGMQEAVLADTVIYQVGESSGRVVQNGEILEFDRQEMQFRLNAPDTIKSIPADKILGFEAFYRTSHKDGVKAARELRFEDAQRLLDKAMQEEARRWVRREILAEQVLVSINQQQWQQAGIQYLALISSNSATRHRDVIPLMWQPHDMPREAQIWAISQLTDEEPAAQLIAASWLLGWKDWSDQAENQLKQLLVNPDPHIRGLARAQLWRVRLEAGNLNDGDLERWERQLLDLPTADYAGPMFLLGQGYERQRRKELATARYLWLSVMDARRIDLASQATMRASDLLESLGQTDASLRLKAEAEQRFTIPLRE